MNITIHRGTHQIGGCVTEITSGNTRIFIDFGSELPGKDSPEDKTPLSIDGLTEGAPRCDGVFFTHTHGDHIGELERILPEIPIYMGSAAWQMQLCLNQHLKKKAVVEALERARLFRAAKPIEVGSITVTPFWVDHSAYDAYMFLIEAEGIRLLHTGDFRTHGFRGKALKDVLEKYVGQVDWLVCEGTMLSRDEETVKKESTIRDDAAALMEKHKQLFVMGSSMNIDRIAAFVSAAPKDRLIICDNYQKDILNIVQAHGAVHTDLYDFSSVRRYDYHSMHARMEKEGFVCFIRPNPRSGFTTGLLERYKDTAKVVYSMWSGYKDPENPAGNEELIALLDKYGCESLHTSGHATREALRMVCDTVRPRKGVIPIHTEMPELFYELMSGYHVKRPKDRQKFEF